MSSKRAKRHQLIVRVSNDNRANNKRFGFKERDVMLLPFRTPKLRCRNLQSEFSRVWRREHPYAGSYKQHKTEMIKVAVWMLEPAGKLKGMGTIK
ncbi:hypothetical protein [Limosilactobacillus mucosae]|uniref:hypothetical protein n=1 Tax=Limosilactobacillus mucosae TaxID=97478 RepID=UPI0022E1C0DB|nr:hypothetical protein [Limosilactobacillus mucosae]